MTPAQRMALLEQAKALMSQAEADDTLGDSWPPQQDPAAAVAPIASTAGAVGQPTAPDITGPGGDTRSSGQPSLAATMRQVWANMKAASTPKKGS